ncbi:MAG: hypothetical protein ACTSYF_13440 [Promethearchaeota archaeon]
MKTTWQSVLRKIRKSSDEEWSFFSSERYLLVKKLKNLTSSDKKLLPEYLNVHPEMKMYRDAFCRFYRQFEREEKKTPS